MSNTKLYKVIPSIFLFVFCVSVIGFAQSFDYEERPRLNFKFSDAVIDLRVDPAEGTIRGSVKYTVEANVNGAERLMLQAPQLQVDSVLTGGKTTAFEQENGVLHVSLTDSSVMQQQYDVQIYYQGAPAFGLHRSSEGSMWTSLLPQSNRHWLPTVDHPGVSLISTLSLTVPKQYSVVATGVKTDEETVANGEKKWIFRTGRHVPVSAISFAIGQFNEEGISYGIKRIDSFAEPRAISNDRQQELARAAENIIRQVEKYTGMEYPFQRLHLVVLNDHYWETKPYGASTVFLYKNRGEWLNQLRRGIYAQWFGVYQREVQWSNSWPIHLFQAALHFETADNPALLKSTEEPKVSFLTTYDNFSVEKWNWWQQYNTWNRSNLQQTARGIIPGILREGPGTYTPGAYENIWYQYSGQPSIDVPQFKAKASTSPTVSDSIIYRVDYSMDPAQQNLQLVFSAQQGRVESSVSLPVDIISGDGANRSSIQLSGAADTVTISLPAGTKNVELNIPEGENIVLEEHKPVPFLLYQLRNAETTEARKKAAVQIGYHTDNPDLQLALNDYMDRSIEPEVKAALLRSFGAITNGATGTQKRFLDALKSDSPQVRSAALDVLKNYPENQQITRQIQEISRQETDNELAQRALKMYMQRIDSTQALQYANTLVRQDTAGIKAITAIGKLAEMGNTVKAVELANFYIEPVYSFEVREKAFQILLSHDSSTEAWSKRLDMLLNASDPRMRFITLKNLDRIPGADPASILEEHKAKEYDARVLRVMTR